VYFSCCCLVKKKKRGLPAGMVTTAGLFAKKEMIIGQEIIKLVEQVINQC
jgi:hypothetical protein